MSENTQPTTLDQAIEALEPLPVNVELCGSWLWISGDTKPHKDALKALGCMCASKKKKWYWREAGAGRAWFPSSTEYNMESIRADYGSKQIKGQEEDV